MSSSINRNPSNLLKSYTIRAALKQSWDDSLPGASSGHDEGGFILWDSTGNLKVIRWLRGEQNSIILPEHSDCRFGEDDVVATFHTHPNTGANYLQEPSETDKRAVRDDPDLKGEFYVGEFVISQEMIYLILPNGHVNQIGYKWEILG
jgi:hypothetical protein